MKKQPILALIIPCFNEEAVLKKTSAILEKIIFNLIKKNKIAKQSFCFFIDDGSQDNTWDLIIKLHKENPSLIKALKLSRNFGHQNAILAGLLNLKNRAEVFITIDADLQDDPEIIEKFVNAYFNGNEIVYASRLKRKYDSIFKRHSAQIYYKLMKFLKTDIIYNHADYRLISHKALLELEKFQEVNLFLRGIFPLIGFKHTTIYYNREKRQGGTAKYPLKKMLSFAFDGITSFSTHLLRFVTITGFIIFFMSLIMSIWIVINKLFIGRTVPGWASIILPIYLIGGIQLLSLGIIGEYIGKIYKETKHRPRYIIEKEI